VFLASAPSQLNASHHPPPLQFDHQLGAEIPTKYKEAICQLYSFAKILVKVLITQYKLAQLTIEKILQYNILECTRIT